MTKVENGFRKLLIASSKQAKAGLVKADAEFVLAVPPESAQMRAKVSSRRFGCRSDNYEVDLDRAIRLFRAHGFRSILSIGGDERIAVDPTTGRNQYGTSTSPEFQEPSFGSSTSSSITPLAFRAIGDAWDQLIGKEKGDRGSVASFFDRIREKLNEQFGVSDSEVVLCASGTETELVALSLAVAVVDCPLTNIVVAPRETGRGVLNAAGGAHFLPTAPFAERLRPGARLEGWGAIDIKVDTVEIRGDDGQLRRPGELDQEVLWKTSSALARGRNVMLHILDVSKTGLGAIDCELARRIVAMAPERVIVVADCCQLRSSPTRVREFLDNGFMVAITGSKFAGGPSFSGALIAPRGLWGRIDALALPAGLRAHSALLDWPERFRSSISADVGAFANFGLGFRWIAAICEIERFHRGPASLARRIVEEFKRKVIEEANLDKGLLPILHNANSAAAWADTIIPIILRHDNGTAKSSSDASSLQCALRQYHRGGEADLVRRFHVGQPVAIGPDIALRVCLGGPSISDIMARVLGGKCFSDAFAPLANDIHGLFQKWRSLGKTRHVCLTGRDRTPVRLSGDYVPAPLFCRCIPQDPSCSMLLPDPI